MSVRDILIGSAISVVSTIGIQTYLFRRAKRFDYRNVVNNLYQLTNETFQRGEVQLEELRRHIGTIKRDPSNHDLLSISGYKPWIVLANEIVKDSTYTAFQRVFGNVLGASDYYYEFRRHVSTLNELCAQMKDIAERAADKYQIAFQDLKHLIQGDFIQIKQSVFKDYGAEYETSLKAIQAILIMAQNQDPPLTIHQFFNSVFIPIYDVVVQTGKTVGRWPTALIEFHRAVERIVFGFRDVVRQNESYVDELEKLHEQMELSLNEMKKSKAFFREWRSEFIF